MSIMKMVSQADTPWTIRTVHYGMPYGLQMCMTNIDEEPLVEFYDGDHPFQSDEKGVMLGQFVSRYKVSTLLSQHQGLGLMLDGGVSKWQLSSNDMEKVRAFIVDDLFPYEDWKYAVANGDTRQGYEDWVIFQTEAYFGFECYPS